MKVLSQSDVRRIATREYAHEYAPHTLQGWTDVADEALREEFVEGLEEDAIEVLVGGLGLQLWEYAGAHGYELDLVKKQAIRDRAAEEMVRGR